MIASLLTLLDSLPEPVTLTVYSLQGEVIESLKVSPRPSPKPPPAKAGEHACRRQLLRVLADAGRRMLLREIMDEFAERGVEWSERTAQRYLAELQAEGVVDRDDDADPPGYGLAGG